MKFRDFMPPEVVMGQPKVVITGNSEALIEGHRGLFSYETGCIRVRSALGIIQVTGDGMTIDHFGREDLLIRGRVDQVSIRGEGE